MAKLIPSSKYSEPQQQQQQQFLQITQHDKFYSRLLSKESSMANPSLRVYYGGASGAVPFVWESQPGTPKRTATANPLPPLTPPPSYHFNHPKNRKKKASKNPTKSLLIQSILPRPKKNPTSITTRRQSPSSPSVSLSSTSTSSSSGSETSSFSSRAEAEEYSVDGGSMPTSMLRGCYSILAMKNVLLSIVGGRHGSSQGGAQP